jgi:hypothetical protein
MHRFLAVEMSARLAAILDLMGKAITVQITPAIFAPVQVVDEYL